MERSTLSFIRVKGENNFARRRSEFILLVAALEEKKNGAPDEDSSSDEDAEDGVEVGEELVPEPDVLLVEVLIEEVQLLDAVLV